uniref:E3 ubiquitin-protein ligase n=1 Tax=Labrus bergylta TaxID=56723 RepID=A0A3Q3LEB2_9LABR
EFYSPTCTAQSSLSESSPRPPAGSGSNLRPTDLTRRDSVQQSRTEIHDTPQESRSAVGGLCICVCGERDKLMKRTKCGATFCSKCLDIEHAQCSVCDEAEQTPQGIQGKMKYSKIYIRVPGHHKDSAIKVTYKIPDGVQGEGHPSPGKPFKGGLFEAFFPDCEETRRQLPRLDKAFKKGLTFTVIDRETGAKVEWDCIPHKTSLQGGKAGSGYPDSFYLTRLSKVLTSHGIEEPTTRYLE